MGLSVMPEDESLSEEYQHKMQLTTTNNLVPGTQLVRVGHPRRWDGQPFNNTSHTTQNDQNNPRNNGTVRDEGDDSEHSAIDPDDTRNKESGGGDNNKATL